MGRRNKKPKTVPVKEPTDTQWTGREPVSPPRPRPAALAIALVLFAGWLTVLAWLAWRSLNS